MGNFLSAALAMRLKLLYDEVKEKKIPAALKFPNLRDPQKFRNSMIENRAGALGVALPQVRAAYREGVDYAVVDIDARYGVKLKPIYLFDKGSKVEVLAETTVRIKAAEAALKTALESYQTLVRVQRGKKAVVSKTGPQAIQIWNTYVRAVRAAVNNVIIRAGNLGVMATYKRYEDGES